jgi:hypothetical protein
MIYLLVLVFLIATYFIGEATGYLFIAMLIILSLWVWLLGLLDGNNQNR